MYSTVNKTLIHKAVIIEHALLPIGGLSDGAAEVRNKYRKFTKNFTANVILLPLTDCY